MALSFARSEVLKMEAGYFSETSSDFLPECTKFLKSACYTDFAVRTQQAAITKYWAKELRKGQVSGDELRYFRSWVGQHCIALSEEGAGAITVRDYTDGPRFLLCKRRTPFYPPPPPHFLKCTHNACSLFFNLFSSPSLGHTLRATGRLIASTASIGWSSRAVCSVSDDGRAFAVCSRDKRYELMSFDAQVT
jgi:hypothetical protein